MSTRVEERWLNLSLVCRRLSITRFTAYRWIDAGRLTGRQTLTGRWQVTESSFRKADAQMSANSANGTSQQMSGSPSS
jgi:predicted site-specific integrase-resolvase